MPNPLIVLGAGNMGAAIIRGALRAGVAAPVNLAAVDPDPAKLEALGLPAGRTGPTADAIRAAFTSDAAVLIAVKPQAFPVLADQLRALPAPPPLVISIMAGVPTAKIASALARDGVSPRVVRVMPNLPVSISMGVSAICAAATASAADLALAERLFSAIGQTVRVEERLMDAFTALAGSGPAYLFYLAEALRRAGESLGFDHATADAVVRATLRGSAELLIRAADTDAETLRAGVTSKGGTTAAAIAVLEVARVIDTFVRALTAARDRGAELARGST